MSLDIPETGPRCILIKLYPILQAVAWSYGNAKTSKKVCYRKENGFLVSKETAVLRRWGRSKQKFGFIKRVDKC